MNRSFFSSNTFKTILRKVLIYGFALFVLIVMQCTVFARLSFLGAVPDLALAATVTVALREGEKTGAIFSIASGFLSCALGGMNTYIYIILSFACGYTVAILSGRVLSKNYPSFLAYAGSAFAAKAIFNLIESALRAESFQLLSTLSHAVIPEFFCSILFCTPVYFAFLGICSYFHRKSKFV